MAGQESHAHSSDQTSDHRRFNKGNGGPEPLARCTVIEVNSDDPVAELGGDLLRDPVRALRVLSALPGSDSTAPGIGHRYRPVLPPSRCGR